jgi:glucose-6-phosphate 1-dehydrogenase
MNSLASRSGMTVLQSLFDIWAATRDCPAFVVFAGARISHEEGLSTIRSIVHAQVSCAVAFPAENCEMIRNEFLDATVSYVQLKDEPHYRELPAVPTIGTRRSHVCFRQAKNTHESGRLFYLSIVPSAFEATTKLLASFSRPSAGTWLR